MIQQVSDFELELMKTIWGNGGTALYPGNCRGVGKEGHARNKKYDHFPAVPAD